MANWNTKSESLGDEKKLKRWEKILALPEDTALYDISNGNTYRRAQFKPIHRNDFEGMVDNFKIIGTGETVHVAFLRLLGDGKTCSLTKKP